MIKMDEHDMSLLILLFVLVGIAGVFIGGWIVENYICDNVVCEFYGCDEAYYDKETCFCRINDSIRIIYE